MAYNPNDPNGQATMANSLPVVVASNQTPVPVTVSGIPSVIINGEALARVVNPVTVASGITSTSGNFHALIDNFPTNFTANIRNVNQDANGNWGVNVQSFPGEILNRQVNPVTVASGVLSDAQVRNYQGSWNDVGFRTQDAMVPTTVSGLFTNAQPVVGNVASAATDSGNPIKTGGKYNSTAPTFTDGQRGDTQLDSRGNIKSVDGAFEVGTPFNAVLNDVDIPVKASAGYLKSISVSNINAAIRYLQIHNKASAPAGGDTPIISFPIAAGSATVPAVLQFGQDDWGPGGLSCTTGISIGISTVAATFTAATTTDHVTTGVYV